MFKTEVVIDAISYVPKSDAEFVVGFLIFVLIICAVLIAVDAFITDKEVNKLRDKLSEYTLREKIQEALEDERKKRF